MLPPTIAGCSSSGLALELDRKYSEKSMTPCCESKSSPLTHKLQSITFSPTRIPMITSICESWDVWVCCHVNGVSVSYFVAQHQRVWLVKFDKNFTFVLNQCLQVICELLLHQRQSQPRSRSSGVCSNSWQVSYTQRHILCFRAIFFNALKQIPELLLRPEQAFLWFQAMAKNMLKHYKEMLQREMIRVELTSIAQRLLEQFLHNKLADVHKIWTFNRRWIAS